MGFIKLYKKKKGKDLRKDVRAVQKLRREVEKAKRALSAAHQVRVEVESLFEGEDFSETLTRAKFEELNMDLFRGTLKPVQKVLEDADLTKKEVDEIVLVGGSTRIPKVQSLVKEFFNGKEPSRGINPDEAVAYGAAVQAGVLSGEQDTGSKEKITITNDQNRLTPEDIEKMINDAEKFADEDAKLKGKVEARNELESYAYSLKNQLSDKEKLGGKLSDEETAKIEEVINEKIAWLEENADADAEELKAQKKEMEDIVQPIIAKLYQGQGGAPPGDDGGEEDDEYKDEL